jgi:TRAP-type mannitol/chloroaromatic compound transport system substrate-binding protein
MTRAARTRLDADIPSAISALHRPGAKITRLALDALRAFNLANLDVEDEESAINPTVKGSRANYVGVPSAQYLWSQAAEYSFDNLLIRQRAQGG